MERPAVLEAKVEKLAEIIADGQDAKRDSSLTVDDARQAQRDAAGEVLESGGSVASVKSIERPSERLE